MRLLQADPRGTHTTALRAHNMQTALQREWRSNGMHVLRREAWPVFYGAKKTRESHRQTAYCQAFLRNGPRQNQRIRGGQTQSVGVHKSAF